MMAGKRGSTYLDAQPICNLEPPLQQEGAGAASLVLWVDAEEVEHYEIGVAEHVSRVAYHLDSIVELSITKSNPVKHNPSASIPQIPLMFCAWRI